MSASVCSHLRNCQALSRQTRPRRMTLRQAIKGVVQRWRSPRQRRRGFASLEGRDLHDVRLSQGDVELETTRPLSLN
jgi:uncharacterized protein YjiS (DUF1127 family)